MTHSHNGCFLLVTAYIYAMLSFHWPWFTPTQCLLFIGYRLHPWNACFSLAMDYFFKFKNASKVNWTMLAFFLIWWHFLIAINLLVQTTANIDIAFENWILLMYNIFSPLNRWVIRDNSGGVRGVMVMIVLGNEHGDTSSNPGRDRLHFT